ncbi:MAG: peptide chain release factor N(5)-glutamine methyltransferase [Alphaproteobacteria bacterium]|nr:peptide chain release factor N(5)-glutamine methyltransferase [Alphaproteobacteria bacterium]
MATLYTIQQDLRDTLTALDARLLVAAACDMTQEEAIINAKTLLTPPQIQQIKAWQDLRLAGMPISRILGTREFYGLAFQISSAVLDPRPDSELIVETALAFYKNKTAHFLDIGTGSGCLAIALLHCNKNLTGVGVDVSRQALRQARINATNLGVGARLALRHNHWLEGLAPHKYDFIISNPPYITTTDIDGLAVDVRDHDPLLALDGGVDGLDAYRAILACAAAYLREGGHIILEIGSDSNAAQGVKNLLTQGGLRDIQQKKDLSGVVRVLIGTYNND